MCERGREARSVTVHRSSTLRTVCVAANARGETHLSLCTTFLLLAFMTLVVSVDIVHCQCCCFVVDVVVIVVGCVGVAAA